VKNGIESESPRQDQRRNQLLATALTAWDLQRTRKRPTRDAQTRHMVLKTHDRLRWLAEAELGVPKQERSFLKAGDASAPGVLLIHDTRQSPADVLPLGRALGEAGLTVHGLLLADYGHGVTERPEARWRATLQQLRLGHRLLTDTCSEVHVVGVGFGAALALHLAARERVASLVLIAPALVPRVPLWVRALWGLRLLRLRRVRRRLGLLVDATEGMKLAQDQVGKLVVPMFGVQCDDDELASPQSLRLLQKRARHERCRFQVFPTGGHDVLAAHGADGLQRDIVDFIKHRA
jgi:esterase/lipase